MKLKSKQEIIDLINGSELYSYNIRNLYNSCFEDVSLTNPLYDYDENDENLNYGQVEEIIKGDIEQVYYQSYGDGNSLEVTILIKPYNLYISFQGTDSSYSDVLFEQCYISVPYEYKETRYEKAK